MTTIVVIIAIVILLALLLAWGLCRAAADTRAVHEDTGEYDE